MTYILHKNEERGRGDYSWLKTRYSFSFAGWYDPSRMGFGTLRVLNDDVIAPGAGFPPHGHKDMEIVTIILSGAVAHKDSTGGEGVVKSGEVQVMSAGTGVVHAEYNASKEEPLSLLQLWIQPKEKRVTPRYAQKAFHFFEKESEDILIVGDKEGSLSLCQNAQLRCLSLKEGEEKTIQLIKDQGVYLFLIQGFLRVDEYVLQERDAIGVSEKEEVTIRAISPLHLLAIMVPMK